MVVSLSGLIDVLSWVGLVGGSIVGCALLRDTHRALKDEDIGEQNMLAFPLAFCITAVLMGLCHILHVRLVP